MSDYFIVSVDDSTYFKEIKCLDKELFSRDLPDLKIGHWWAMFDERDYPLVAYCGMVPSADWYKTGYLCRAGVREECQGQGLQKRLINVRVAKARRLGWEWVVSDTDDNNHASSNSLIACGFRLYTPENRWAGRKGVLYWRKDLIG